MNFLDELDEPVPATAAQAPATAQAEFAFDAAPAAPASWQNDWGIVPPNVKPEYHARAKAHFEPKGTEPGEAYRAVLTKQGGKLTEAQVISIGGDLNPFEAPVLAAPASAGINPPKKRGRPAAPAAAPTPPLASPAPVSLNETQIMIRNTIVATRCVPAMQPGDIDALIAFATQIAVKLGAAS